MGFLEISSGITSVQDQALSFKQADCYIPDRIKKQPKI
jgi:hypothetical protein